MEIQSKAQGQNTIVKFAFSEEPLPVLIPIALLRQRHKKKKR